MAIHVHTPNFFASRSTTEVFSTSVSNRNRETPSHRQRNHQSSASSIIPPRTSSNSNNNHTQQNPSGTGSRSGLGRLTSASALALNSFSPSSSASASSPPPINTETTPNHSTTNNNNNGTSNARTPPSPSRSLAFLTSASVSRDNLLLSHSQTTNNSSSRFPILSGLIHRSRPRPSLPNPRSNQESLPSQITRRSTDDHHSASSAAPAQSPQPTSSTEDQHQSSNPQQSSSRSITSKTSTYFPVLRRMQSRRREKESLATNLSSAQTPAIPNASSSTPTPLRQPRNRRSLSQPPPIPRVVRSATDRLRSHRPTHVLSNSAGRPSSNQNSQATEHHSSETPSQPLAAVGASHNNATVADVTNAGMNPSPFVTDDGRESGESQPEAALYSLRLVPHLDATRSLHFDPVERKIPCSTSLKIGRFTDRGLTPGSTPLTSRIAFKSKVVSRGHADIFTDASGNFFIKDTKSSSGTFLNHIRLSAPGGESRPFPLRDGDILQLGVDYQGGTEEIYRCVKMRVELNRGWQRSANVFNQQALSQLRSLGVQGTSSSVAVGSSQKFASGGNTEGKGDPPKAVSDCCICLFGVTVCQALFIAPCSHTYHYKCIRPLLQMHHPGFSCPLCRTFADLEADVETEEVTPKSPVAQAPEILRASEDLPPVPEAPGDVSPPLPLDPSTPHGPPNSSNRAEAPGSSVKRSVTLISTMPASAETRDITVVPTANFSALDSRIEDSVRLGTPADLTMRDPSSNSPNTSRNSSLSQQPFLGEASSHLFVPEERGDDKKDGELGVVERIRISTGSIGSMNCSTEEPESPIQTAVIAVKRGEDRVRLGSHPMG